MTPTIREMRCAVLLLGESFRLGGQGTRNRGSEESYSAQMAACQTHVAFFEHLKARHGFDGVDVYLTSYTTQFDDRLLEVYGEYVKRHTFYDDVIELDNLYRNTLPSVVPREQYEFVLFLRVDLFLKPRFTEVFDPTWTTIRFPTICWMRDHVALGRHPRINDMLLFVPKNHFEHLSHMRLASHELWYLLVEDHGLSYDSLDTMIDTYHDSDSAKDFNPLYYIVNRHIESRWFSEGHVFDKYSHHYVGGKGK